MPLFLKYIFYLYFLNRYFTSTEHNLKVIQNILLPTNKICKDKLKTY